MAEIINITSTLAVRQILPDTQIEPAHTPSTQILLPSLHNARPSLGRGGGHLLSTPLEEKIEFVYHKENVSVFNSYHPEIFTTSDFCINATHRGGSRNL